MRHQSHFRNEFSERKMITITMCNIQISAIFMFPDLRDCHGQILMLHENRVGQKTGHPAITVTKWMNADKPDMYLCCQNDRMQLVFFPAGGAVRQAAVRGNGSSAPRTEAYLYDR